MARKIVDIGVEGNDGTGDSIREAFRKTNDNFRELYAIFGQEGTLSFLDLGDTPDTYASPVTSTEKEGRVMAVNSLESGIEIKRLKGKNGLEVKEEIDPTTGEPLIVLEQAIGITELGTPTGTGGGKFANHINAQQFLIGNLPDFTNEAGWLQPFNNATGLNLQNLNSMAISKGYADKRYVNISGDTMTGALNVPAGASGSQVPRASETVLKTGGIMTGALYLNDHPGELAGAGSPNGSDDLLAATKYYVDNTAYASKVNLYVSTDGDDSQKGVPPGKEGRAWSYAYRTLSTACLKAEQLIKSSPWELGPYRQLIAIDNGKAYSTIQKILPRQGINGTTRITFNNNNGKNVDQGDPANRDIIPGKLIVGRTSGARGFIVKYGLGTGEDFVDLRNITGTFVLGENLFFDNPVKSLEISIFVESGIYFEDLPIKIPQNTSILGDEFRRTVIRPADRISRSPWVTTWFFRDTDFDGLSIAETNWGYHYLSDPTNKASTPKNNRDLDVFLCNDATIIRQISCQGHGGFMMVLDPEGQILTKSPYCQQSGSFAGSLNIQRFAGGQYVDGMAGSMPVTYKSKSAENDKITVTDAFREPTTPTAFFVEGKRYKIDTYTYSSDPIPYPAAQELLQLNKDFIVAETLAYVADVVTPTFTYDKTKCSRDLGFIINAMSWDFLYGETSPTNKGSNIQTVLVAQAYFLRESYTAYNTAQKEVTKIALLYLKERFLALVDNNAVAKERVEASFYLLFNVLDIGVATIQLTATSWSYNGTTITVNKNNHGLKKDWPITVTGVVIPQGSTSTNPPNGTFTISEVVNANQFKYVVTNAPTGAFQGALIVTVNAVSEYYFPKPLPIAAVGNPNNILNQDILNSYDILIGNRDFIADEYVAQAIKFFTDDNFDPPFSNAVYKRDIERLFNAIIYDSILGGNSQTVTVLKSYYVNSGNFDKLIIQDVPAMQSALNWIIDIIDNVATNQDVDPKRSNTNQFKIQGLAASAFSTTIKNSVKEKFNIALAVVLGNYQSIPPSVNPSTSTVSPNLLESKILMDVSSNSLRGQVIDYIDEQFLFDSFDAGIDIGFLVDAISHDILYGGNLRVTEHALNYYVGTAEKVLDAERARTRQIVNYVYELAKLIVENDPVPSTGIVKRRQFGIRQNTRTSFTGGSPVVISPDITWVDAPFKAAVNEIEQQKTTIINAVVDEISIRYPSLNFDPFTCARDLENILDAVKWDVLFNSDYQSIKAAMAYFRGIETGIAADALYPAFTSTAPQNATKAATLEAIQYLEQQVISKLTNTTFGTAGSRYGARISLIYDILNGGTAAIPGGFNNTTFNLTGTPNNYDPNNEVARTALANNKEFIVEEIVAWINNRISNNIINFANLVYDIDKCKRDLRFIIDAIRYDLKYGGNLATIQAADAYYVNAVLQLPPGAAGVTGQREATRQTFIRLQEVVGWIVRDVDISALLVPGTSQSQKYSTATQNTSTADAGVTVETIAKDRVGEIVSAVTVTDENSQPRLEELFNKIKTIVDGVYTFSTVTESYTLPPIPGQTPVQGQDPVSLPSITNRLETRDLIVLNRNFIKTEIVDYLNYKYSWKVVSTSSSTDRFTIGTGSYAGNAANLTNGMPVQFISTNPFNNRLLTATTPTLIVGGEYNGKYKVTFTYPLLQSTPDGTIEYEIYNQANSNYNTSAKVFYTVNSTTQQNEYAVDRTFITLVFEINPNELAEWEWDDDSISYLRAAGGIFGGVSRDQKYYVINKSGSTFQVTATKGSLTPIQLSDDSSSTGMVVQLAYNRDVCSRDVGFIVSNIATDILYGGDLNSVRVALRYYAQTAELVLSEQKTETLDGIGYIYNLLEKVIFNETVPIDYQKNYREFLKGSAFNATENTEFEKIKIFQQKDSSLNQDLPVLKKDRLKFELDGLVDLVKDIVANGQSSVPTVKTILPTYVLVLNEDTLLPANWPLINGDQIIIQSAGNTSMLSNDWTQLNDLGYGLIATNNGLLETVSVFTYYCWTAFYARNGGQIRSVGGSNAHGEYGLVAEGNDPFEVPDSVFLADDMIQTATIFAEGPYANVMEAGATQVYIDNYGHLPYNISELEINHGYFIPDGGKRTEVGVVRYEISNVTDVSTLLFGVTPTITNSVPQLVGGKYRLTFEFPSRDAAPPVGKLYVISNASGANANLYNDPNGWLCVSSDLVSVTLEFTSVNFGSITLDPATTSLRLKQGTVLRLNLNTGGNNNTSSTGLQADLTNDQLITIRSNQNFKFINVDNINPVRPSTALTFTADPVNSTLAKVYRVLSYVTKDPLGVNLIQNDPVIQNEIILTFDETFDYIDIAVYDEFTQKTEIEAGLDNPSGSRTLGSKAGDKFIAVKRIRNSTELSRLASGELCFGWNGRVHRIVQYLTRTINSTIIGIIEITETRKSPQVGSYQNTFGTSIPTGITAPVKYSRGYFVKAATYDSGSGQITYQLENKLTSGNIPQVQYTVIGNSNTNFNITAQQAVNFNSNEFIKIQVGTGLSLGTFDTSSITRIIPTSDIYNNSLINGSTVTLKVGLSKNEPADIVINISTCRATSHDFLDIGSGGYNTTNYPNKIYGKGREKRQKNEVQERRTGRVFWVSTDQDGFVRIGRFFTVDQGTGTVSFAASLALSNLDGLGFKRGRTISEFSDDPTFQDLADDAVPTEGAVDEYLNRRLGLDREGNIIDNANLISTGFVARNGKLAMLAQLNMGGFKITNVGTPNGDPSDDNRATNQLYVRSQQMSNDRVTTVNRQDNDILVYDGVLGKWVNARTTSADSQIQVDLVSTQSYNVNLYVKRETLDNRHISGFLAAERIEQQKLKLNTATTQRNDGVKVTEIITSANATITAEFTKEIFNPLNPATPSVAVTGSNPNYNVTFQLDEQFGSVKPRTDVYYTIRDNQNTKFLGTYFAVSSTAKTLTAKATITLRYAEDPTTVFVNGILEPNPIAGGDNTKITVHETKITTNLPHELVVGDSVEISGVTVSAGPNLNGSWKVLDVISSTEFTINLDTYDTTGINYANASIRKLGLATFNKGQFELTNGFASFKNSTYNTFSGTVNLTTAANKITNINTPAMAFMSIGAVVKITSIPQNTDVKNPTTIDGAGYESVELPVIQTITSIGTDEITLSSSFVGTSTTAVSGIQFAVIDGIALNSLQQIPRNTILGNLSGANNTHSTPTLVTTQQIVEAGDGIKNAEFNNSVLTTIVDSNGDSTVKGLMAILKSEVESRDNTYGVFAITQKGENSKIVMTTSSGQIEAKEYVLDTKKVIGKNVSEVRFYTPGGSRILTATGDSAQPADATIYLGAYNDPVVQSLPLGNVYFPSITAYGEVTLNPSGANVSIQPTRPEGGTGGSITIKPGITGSIDNMQIGAVTASTGKFTSITASNEVNIDSVTESSAIGTGALVVDGGASVAKNLNVGGNVLVKGTLLVEGNTVTLDSSTLTVDDKIIRLGRISAKIGLVGVVQANTNKVTNTNTSGLLSGMVLTKTGTQAGSFGNDARINQIESATEFTFTPTAGTATDGDITFNVGGATDVTADGGGIALQGQTVKSVLWDDTNDNWTSSEHWNLVSGKEYKINNVVVLNPTTILGSATGITVGGPTTTAMTLGSSGLTSVGIGSNTSAANTVTIGGAVTNNTLKISSTSSGTINLTTDVTTGTANIFTSLSGGTVNIGSANMPAVTITNKSRTAGQATLTTAQNHNLLPGQIVTIDCADNTFDAVDVTLKDGTLGQAIVYDNPGSNVANQPASGTVAFVGNSSSGKLNLAFNSDSVSPTTGALVVAGGAGFGGAVYTAGKVQINSTVQGTISGSGVEADPFVPKTGSFVTLGGAVIAKDLQVIGNAVFKGNITIAGDVSGTAASVKTVKNDVAGAKYLTLAASNHSTLNSSDIFTATSLTYNPLADGSGELATGVFKGSLDGTANVAKKAWTKTGGTAATAKYLVYVDSDNNSAAASDLTTKAGLTFKEDLGEVEATQFRGQLKGNADSASKVFVQTRDSDETVHYLAFVDSNNQDPDADGQLVAGVNELVYTSANIQVIPKVSGTTNTSRLIVGEVQANLTGTVKGNIQNAEGEAVLTVNNDPDKSTFAGNSATATSWKYARNIQLTGAVTSNAIALNGIDSATGTLEIATALAAGTSAADITTAHISSTNSNNFYLMFTGNIANEGQSVASAPSVTNTLVFNRSNINYSNKPTLSIGAASADSGFFIGTAVYARYADLAENYLADKAYEPGTVLVFGGDYEVTVSTEFNDRRVAGVVSTNPGYVMNDVLRGDTVVSLALQGRVPCKVIGKVKKGDLMVTSGVPGYAIVNNDPKIGTVIGKALEDKNTDDRGIIEVVVGRV